MPIPETLQPGLLRQRRFLILMSMAVIAFYWLGVDVQGSAEYSGIAVTLDHPGRVEFGLWAVWGWALWRYGQRIYEALAEIWQEILEDVRAEDLRIALRKAKTFGKKLAKQGHFDDIPKSARVRVRGSVKSEAPNFEALRQEFGEEISRYRNYQPTKDGGRKYMSLSATFDWVDGSKWASVGEHFQMQLTRWQAHYLRIRAWLHSAIRLPAMSEHIGPLMIAALAMAAPVCRFL